MTTTMLNRHNRPYEAPCDAACFCITIPCCSKVKPKTTSQKACFVASHVILGAGIGAAGGALIAGVGAGPGCAIGASIGLAVGLVRIAIDECK